MNKYYIYEPPPEKAARIRTLYAGLSLLPAMLYLAAGLLDTGMGRVAFTALPYAVNALPTGMVIASVYPVVRGRTRFDEKRYGKAFTRTGVCGWASALLSLWCLIGTLIITFGETVNTAHLPSCACFLAAMSASVVFSRFHSRARRYVRETK